MAERITAFLMFEGKLEEAMNFYVSLFPDSRIDRTERMGPEGPAADGTLRTDFTVNGWLGDDGTRRLSVRGQLRLGRRPVRRLVAAQPRRRLTVRPRHSPLCGEAGQGLRPGYGESPGHPNPRP